MGRPHGGPPPGPAPNSNPAAAARGQLTPWPHAILWALPLLAVACAAAARDAWLLFRHPVAAGVDGYYYVLQVESLHAAGRLFFPNRAPLVIYFLAGLKLFVSAAVPAVKLGSLLLHALLAAGVFSLLKSLLGSTLHAACGLALAAASGAHLYMVSEYVSQLGGAALLVWGCYFAAGATRGGGIFWKAGAALCLAAAFLSHRSSLPLAVALAASSCVYSLITRAGAGRRGRVMAWGAALVLLLLAPLLVAAWSHLTSPEGPASLPATFAPHAPVGRVALLEKAALLCCSVLFLAVGVRRPLRRRGADAALGGVAVLSLLLTLNPLLDRSEGMSGAAERLGLLAYVQLAVLLPALLWRWSLSAGRRAVPASVAAVICLSALGLGTPPPHGLGDEYLRDRADLIESLAAKRETLFGPAASRPTVIAPHGDQFVVTYAAGVPARQRAAPGQDPAQTYWLLRRGDGAGPGPLGGAVAVDERRTIFLVPEASLDALLRATPAKESLRLARANPHLRERIMAGAEFRGTGAP